ncbi:nitroreductase family protein [Sedimentisphaera salicampi]|uniref:Malonic semialdehyde reductase n=1 Tax=Sedimentisphaera salicampi TaxID=1941349 RepID=A0A1W6LLT7_9BACT|nr:nitroreductase family protein [Sedimentisphaera salicampi]ARN56739.1 malonic semialdehyde reductase [Sedimentisphaera salicampi]OXU15180.1 malonic semialdehyde reductase [Sedimentisphaera salicampi]
MQRKADKDINPVFLERWSPRAFSDEPITQEQILTILEAARWSPSCYNEQPWRFAVALSEEKKKAFVETLVKPNQAWAGGAAALIYIVYKKTYMQSGNPNEWAFFDAGASWMAMALQSQMMGISMHAMAGFKQQKAAELLGLSDDYAVAAAVAVGRKGDKTRLPEQIQAMEEPSGRMPAEDLLIDF